MPEEPAQRPVERALDPAMGDMATMVAMDVVPEPPVASPLPPPSPLTGYDAPPA